MNVYTSIVHLLAFIVTYDPATKSRRVRLLLLMIGVVLASALSAHEIDPKAQVEVKSNGCVFDTYLSVDPGHLMEIDTPLPYRNYTNAEYLQFQFDTEVRDRNVWVETEQRIQERSKKYEARDQMTVSLVFHILHSADAEKIQEDISYQVQALNRDFGRPEIPEKDDHDREGSFASLAADTGIRFVLSTQKEDAEGLEGIARISDHKERWNGYDAMKDARSGSPPVDPQHQINIWVIHTDDRIGSYAQVPGGPDELDGIVIDSRYFGRGSPAYNEGKTLTHLIGNYLGLYDLWGLYRCSDDGVEDTPIHNAPNLGQPNAKRISTCDGLPRAMVMNFMDGTDDRYQYMFTKGQVRRMRYMLSPQGLRPNLSKAQ